MVTDASIVTALVPLFVPATRLDRLNKAATSGADAIIIDLEDAVSNEDKAAARSAVAAIDLPRLPTMLRVNAPTTPWCAEDLQMAATKDFAAIMLPKTEGAETIAAVSGPLGASVSIVALIETARGLASLSEIVRAPSVRRLAFGSIDFATDLGCAHESESLLHARSEIVLRSRLGGLAAPIDGVTMGFNDETVIESDARRAAALGFCGKLCIHPRQIAPVLRGFAPSQMELAWAEEIQHKSVDGVGSINGMMIDTPVRRKAEQILARASRLRILDRGAAL